MEIETLYSDEIELTAYDCEAHRIARLERIVGYVQALADYYGNKHILRKVARLHDHKGDMTVSWKRQPTDGEKEMFKKAWESSIGDGGGNTEHEIEESRSA